MLVFSRSAVHYGRYWGSKLWGGSRAVWYGSVPFCCGASESRPYMPTIDELLCRGTFTYLLRSVD